MRRPQAWHRAVMLTAITGFEQWLHWETWGMYVPRSVLGVQQDIWELLQERNISITVHQSNLISLFRISIHLQRQTL